MNYALVLGWFYSGKKWVLEGNSYDGLKWSDPDPKPSDADLIALLSSAEAKENARKEINELKGKLIATDYLVLPDYDKSKPDVIAERQQWRDRIRELEAI